MSKILCCQYITNILCCGECFYMNNDPVFVRINTLLVDQGRMQKDLISYLGMAKNTYTQWKAGACRSYGSHLLEISKFLNVSLNFLAEGIERNDTNLGKEKQLFIYDLSEDERQLFQLLKGMSEIDMDILKSLSRIDVDNKKAISQICNSLCRVHK